MSIDLTQYGYPSVVDAKASLFNVMREHGVNRVEAHYSGGNDEGGVQSLEVLQDPDGKDLPKPDSWITRDPRRGEELSPWQVRDGKVHEYHPLWEALDKMLSTEFGSWAGEFSAYGTLTADIKENLVQRVGEMSSYDSDEHTY